MHGLASFVFVDDLPETMSNLPVLLNNMKTHLVQSRGERGALGHNSHSAIELA